jgi:SAM-dependent methyltransferase
MTAAPDIRHRSVAALARARSAAYLPEAYVGQESFVSAAEILELARAAGVGEGTRVLDLCCGVSGPGSLIARSTRCLMLGVDSSPSALALANDRAVPGSRFVAARVPALPLEAAFEVVLLIETVLAFADKQRLVAEVARLLAPGGRFAFTFEEGAPLSPAERASIPGGDTVWLIDVVAMRELLAAAGLVVRSIADHTAAHAACAARLRAAFAADCVAIAAALGAGELDALLAAHARWTEWLGGGRVRKLAVVCEVERVSPA